MEHALYVHYDPVTDTYGMVDRCVVCARCGQHTGNTHQGHYWALCRVTGTIREFHFCCEDGCELEAGKDGAEEDGRRSRQGARVR